jgi:hypothetical protein
MSGGTNDTVLREKDRPNANPHSKIEMFSAADLMTLDLPPMAPVVENLLYEGVTLLAGKPKMGKSWMMLDLALAVATGGLALGRIPVQQGEVLYLALEDNRRRLQGRIRKLLAGREVPSGLHFASSCPRLDEGGLEALDAILGDRSGIKLVICDTLARFKPAGSKKRTQYDEDREAVDALIPLADKHGVAIVPVHHLREMESDDPLDMITGSVGLTGGVDGALVLKRRRGEPDAFLYGDGRDYEYPVELALKWDQSAATWSVLGDAESYKMSKQRRAILKVLEETDETLGPKMIHEMLNAKGIEMGEGAVREMLSQMTKNGQVKNLGRGQYIHPANANEPDNADTLT